MKSSDGGEFTEPNNIWKKCKCNRASYVYGNRCPLCVQESKDYGMIQTHYCRILYLCKEDVELLRIPPEKLILLDNGLYLKKCEECKE